MSKQSHKKLCVAMWVIRQCDFSGAVKRWAIPPLEHYRNVGRILKFW